MQSLVRLCTFTLLVTSIAGCLGPGDAGPGPEAAGVSETPTPPAEPYFAEWDGEYRVSGAGEAPAHFGDTYVLGHLVWENAMLDIDVVGTPGFIVAQLDWTGIGAVQLMVATLHDGDVFEYTVPAPDEYASEGPLCLLVPDEGLRDGMWQFMLHSAYGAQLEYTINVTIDGEAGEPYQAPEHWPTAAAYAMMVATGHVSNEPAPCSEA